MGKSLRVLVVDDCADDAELLLHALRQGGYEPTSTVVDTEEAMRAALAREDWDVITSDHAMPQFSAPASLAVAKALRPDLPFIIVSGEIDLGLAVSLLRAGAQDYIQKSDLTELVPAVERSLQAAQERRKAERLRQALENSELRYRRIFETGGDGILILDAQTGEIEDANPCFTDMLGYQKSEILRKPLWQFCLAAHTQGVMHDVAALQKSDRAYYGCLPLQTRDGRELDMEFIGTVYAAGKRKLIQCNMRSPARLEEPWGLPGRTLFQDRMSQAISLAERNRYKLSLLYLDLDDFDAVLESLNSDARDEVIKNATSRIVRRVRVSDTVARVGSGELAILLPRITDPGDAAIVARKVIDTLIDGFSLTNGSERQIRLGANIGIAIFPNDGPNSDALLKAANHASHQARRTGSSYSFGTA